VSTQHLVLIRCMVGWLSPGFIASGYGLAGPSALSLV